MIVGADGKGIAIHVDRRTALSKNQSRDIIQRLINIQLIVNFMLQKHLVDILKIWRIRYVLKQEEANVARAMGRDLGQVDIDGEARAHVGVKRVRSRAVLAAVSLLEIMGRAHDNRLFAPVISRSINNSQELT